METKYYCVAKEKIMSCNYEFIHCNDCVSNCKTIDLLKELHNLDDFDEDGEYEKYHKQLSTEKSREKKLERIINV